MVATCRLAAAYALAATFHVHAAAVTESPSGSCGVTPVPECMNDMGSCGNACCAAEFRTDKTPSEVFALMTRYLESGGSDGLFGYKTGGTSGLGISGGADQGTWDSIFQGTHTTIKMRYVDTLNFAVRTKPEGRGSVVRAFSISDIAGALGDEGQNRRTVSLVGSDLGFGPMSVLFGCGDSPSLPEVTGTALMLETGTPGVSMEPAVADSARLRELSFVALGSAVCTLMAVRLRKSIGGHVLTEAQREQAPYQRVM